MLICIVQGSLKFPKAIRNSFLMENHMLVMGASHRDRRRQSLGQAHL
jgi:hypothetical protein